MSRFHPLSAFIVVSIFAARPLPAQVSLQPWETWELPAQHSYFIGLEFTVTQPTTSGRRVYLFTTQESYSSALPYSAAEGWRKEFDITPFNVNIFEQSSVAISPANPNTYYFTGGLSLNRSIRFQQSPIAVIDNQRIGNLQFIPQSIVLRAPTTPGGSVQVFYSVSGEDGDTPGIYRHDNVEQMPWNNSTGIAATSGVGALRFGPDGLLNVIDTQTNRITRYNPDTLAYVSDFALGNTNTDRTTFLITTSGFVFTTFTDSAAGAIYSYATGAFLGNYGLGITLNASNGLGGKSGMATDPLTGLLYVLTANSAGESLVAYPTVDLMDFSIGTINTFQSSDVRAAPLVASSLNYLNLTSGTATQSGVISGSGQVIKKGAGTLVFSASNTYTGGTTVDNGTLLAAFTGTKGTFADHSTVTVNYWGTLAVDGESLGSGSGTAAVVLNYGTLTSLSTTGQATTLRDVTMTSGLITQSGNGRFILDGSLTVIPSFTHARIDADLELRNAIFNVPNSLHGDVIPLTVTSTLSGSGSLVKNGNGILYLTGTNTYTGTTMVNAGMLLISANTSLTSSVITVAQGAYLGKQGGLTIASGQTLSGSGTINSATTFASGAHLAPGNSPGTLTIDGNATWNGGATYAWEINNANGTAGTNYDLLSVSGTLTISASGANPFNLSLVSLTTANGSGSVVNFDSSRNYSYTIASASGGIIGFSADAFTINTTGFANTLNGGTWSLGVVGNNLTLNFSAAIPEPSTYAAMAGALALGLAIWRRRLVIQ